MGAILESTAGNPEDKVGAEKSDDRAFLDGATKLSCIELYGGDLSAFRLSLESESS